MLFKSSYDCLCTDVAVNSEEIRVWKDILLMLEDYVLDHRLDDYVHNSGDYYQACVPSSTS